MSTQGAGGFRQGAGKTKAVQAKLDQLGCDPIEALANISMDNSNTPELRFQANKELAQYVAPKRKAVELDAAVDGGINVNLVSFAKEEEK